MLFAIQPSPLAPLSIIEHGVAFQLNPGINPEEGKKYLRMHHGQMQCYAVADLDL